jgi:pyruvate dehydrogenase E2 component (dihydrolipoamide acetyltransferase)
MTDVVMPRLGKDIVAGAVVRWLKRPGQPVRREESLFEISTDKVDGQVPSPADGTLSEILVTEGETVAANTVVARLALTKERTEK